jgi:TetR/AcrR family transcriptional repressor of nem operon
VARSLAFDRAAALDRALDVFWLRGYQATSINELLAAMEIGRGSLYATFGGKAEVFVAVLDLYRERWAALIARHAKAPGPARTVLIDLLRVMGQQITSDHLGRGCLIANSAVELRHLDGDAQQLVRQSLERLEATFTALTTRAAAEGALAQHQPVALARFLIAALNGIRDVAKAGGDRARIHELVESLLAIF